MKALCICENLMEAITNKEIVKGRVHSVFNGACNIETDHNFITLLSDGKIMSPMSMIVKSEVNVDFKKLKVIENLIFDFDVNGIQCVEKNIFISLQQSKRWNSNITEKLPYILEKEVVENIKNIENELNLYGKLYNFAPLINITRGDLEEFHFPNFNTNSEDKSFQFIRTRFVSFIQTLLKGDANSIAEKAEKIIGFGSGLTPSMDDFICGIMISFIYLGSYYNLDISKIYGFNKKLIKNSLHKTTKVSSEMLKHSASGRVNEAVKDLMEAILCSSNKEKVTKALKKTISFGETSGSDTALGIYVGCKIMTNLKYRRVWVNETMCGY